MAMALTRTPSTASETLPATTSTPTPTLGPATIALHGLEPKRITGESLAGSIVQSTSFRQSSVGGAPVPHAYSRCSNPTVDDLEVALGAIENAPPAVTFGTGLAAETALFLSVLRAGDHVVLGDCIYGGTVRLVQQVLAGLGITHTFAPSTDPEKIRAAITPRTKLVFIETPANPTLVLTDIQAIADICKPRNILLAVDNTFLTPVILRPLDLGADIAVYSTTKHIEGHGAALGGALTARDPALLARFRFIRKSTGAIQSPLNAYLTLRGLRTLPLRVREHSRHAQVIAQWLESNPAVARVNYPGLESFPQAALARRAHATASGTFHGGVLSFELLGGVPAALAFLSAVRLCTLAEHVGSIESIVTHSATMTHADVPAEQRRAAGISDGLVRLSVGLEDPADVIADLTQALAAAHAAVNTPAVETKHLAAPAQLVAAK
jgi:cystathionine beta-lyase/cystathionine gamma-synthase